MIVFLHGPDTYRSRQKLKEIVFSYEKAHQGQVRSFYFDCKEAVLADAQRALQTISLFERKKLVILENIFSSSVFTEWAQEEKENFQKSEQHVVVLFEPGEIKAKTQNKLYQWLKKHAKQQEFLLLSPAKLKVWIEQESEKYNLQIKPRTQEMLARAVGNDLWRLAGEIKKIAAFKLSTKAPVIKEEDISLFVEMQAEADVFQTIDEAAQKNKKQAVSLLYRHLKKGDSPHYLFSMFVYQFRTLVEIRDLLDKKLSRQQIVQKTKLHPYVVQKGMRVAEKFSFSELKQVYEKLFVLDRNLKTGKANPEAALDMFVATL